MTIDPGSRVLRRGTGGIDRLSETPREVDRGVSRLARSMDGQCPSCCVDLANEPARFLKRRWCRGEVECISTDAASAHRGRHAAVARACGLV
jgi:hypothetical protein